jgi:hypothetical protein
VLCSAEFFKLHRDNSTIASLSYFLLSSLLSHALHSQHKRTGGQSRYSHLHSEPSSRLLVTCRSESLVDHVSLLTQQTSCISNSPHLCVCVCVCVFVYVCVCCRDAQGSSSNECSGLEVQSNALEALRLVLVGKVEEVRRLNSGCRAVCGRVSCDAVLASLLFSLLLLLLLPFHHFHHLHHFHQSFIQAGVDRITKKKKKGKKVEVDEETEKHSQTGSKECA